MAEEPFLGVAKSITGRYWRARLDDERGAQALQQRLDIPEMLARVLAARGVSIESGERYLDPKLKTDLPDPSSFQDMDKAAGRLAQAVTGGEGIAVFGDYDVDGATSAALLLRFFRAIGSDARLYVPDRLTEGYGPNAPALRQLRSEGADVAVTLDCGIVAFEALAAAAEVGLDIIVVDHHLATPELPIAAAIVNPNRLDDTSAAQTTGRGWRRLSSGGGVESGAARCRLVCRSRRTQADRMARSGRVGHDLRRGAADRR